MKKLLAAVLLSTAIFAPTANAEKMTWKQFNSVSFHSKLSTIQTASEDFDFQCVRSLHPQSILINFTEKFTSKETVLDLEVYARNYFLANCWLSREEQ